MNAYSKFIYNTFIGKIDFKNKKQTVMLQMLVLDVLMHANDPVNFQMCPGIDCECQNFLNPSAKVKPIATFCETI